jgi:TonB family protein
MFAGTRSILTATVDQVDGTTETAPEFLPDEARGARLSPERAGAEAEVQAGKLLKSVQAIYPESAKLRHVQGIVVVHGTIGLDGKLHDLSIVSSPDASLSYAAKESVAQWVYEPYRLSGKPVEVDTLINVMFNLGGR